MKHAYHNPATPAERAAVHRNDQRVRKDTGTYHAHAAAESAGGRYAAVIRTHLTGSDSVPWVPPQPSSSPWANEPVGHERPLGFSVDEVPPVGEVFELERNMAESRGGEGVKTPSKIASKRTAERRAAGSDVGRRSDVVETSSPPLTKQKSRIRP
jgi:hypothetical protein